MNALRDSVVKEVATLKRALDDQAEFAAKLDCQKQLLVQHVRLHPCDAHVQPQHLTITPALALLMLCCVA